jgi:hypothetical protein
MPANSFSGVRATVAQVDGVASFNLDRTRTWADVTAIPGGGTTINLPALPEEGDFYGWSNPDLSCGVANPITLAASAGTTFQGGAATLSLTTAGGAGFVVYFAEQATWVPILGGLPGEAGDSDIFGLGTDGALTLTVDTPAFVGGDYTTFTTVGAITLTGAADRPIIIRATESITLGAGLTIDGSTLITAASLNEELYGSIVSAPGGSGGGGGGNGGSFASASGLGVDLNNFQGYTPLYGLYDPGGPTQITPPTFLLGLVNRGLGYTPAVEGTIGLPGVPSATGGAGGPASSTAALSVAPGTVQASFADQIRLRCNVMAERVVGGCPGASGMRGGLGGQGIGANGGSGGAGGQAGVGGNGGATIYLVAPTITIEGIVTLRSNGGDGTAGTAGSAGSPGGLANNGGGGGGGGGGSGGGGCGGLVMVRAFVLNGAGVFHGIVLGGAGNAARAAGGVGGASGGGAGAAGGAGSAGQPGAAGVNGFTSFGLIGT